MSLFTQEKQLKVLENKVLQALSASCKKTQEQKNSVKLDNDKGDQKQEHNVKFVNWTN